MEEKKQKNRTQFVATLAKVLAVFLVMSTLVACKSKEEPKEEEAAEKSTGSLIAVPNTATMTDIPEDQTLSGAGPSGNLFLVATPSPNPIPFQELVEFEVRVYEDAEHTKLAEGVKLDQVRPMMPAHGHGMKTKPEIEKVEDGVFRVHGMQFHMQGDGDDGAWTIDFLLRDAGQLEVIPFDLQCCRP